MKSLFIYLYPFIINMLVGVFMFVGPMRAAEHNASLVLISFMLTGYGVGYVIMSLFMSRIIKPKHAKLFITIASLYIALLCVILGLTQNNYILVGIYIIIPVGTSLFFNAFQAFMKDVQNAHARPLSFSVSSYISSLSIGFSLGPFISGWIREISNWSNAYYFGAVMALFIALFSLYFKPAATIPQQKVTPVEPNNKPDLSLSGWIGAFTGIIIISLFLTVFPKQSEQLAMRPFEKGIGVFLLNISQAMFVLIYARYNRFIFKYNRLPLFGLLAIAGLLLVFFTRSITGIYLAVSILGFFACTMFFSSVFYSLSHSEHSVRNISINEVSVGTGFLLGPQLANIQFLSLGYKSSYFLAILLVVILMFFQYFYIKHKTVKNGLAQ